jgi:hypothetical protein
VLTVRIKALDETPAASPQHQQPINTAMHLPASNPTRYANRMIRLAGSAAFAILLICGARARTWTSSDGAKTFEGELKSYDPATGSVGVTLANGKTLSFNQTKLSETDIAFLKEKGAVAAPSKEPASSGGGISAKALPDVLPDPDGKEADMSKPVQVYILMGQSNMVGLGNLATLEEAVKTKGKYPYLVDDAGKWTVRKDVRNVFIMSLNPQHNDWMSIDNRDKLGPEYGIGHCLGTAIDAPVMILKSCIGNRSLGWDLLPPGSEPYEHEGKMNPGYRGTPTDPKGNGEKVSEWYAGKQYDDDVEGAKQILADLDSNYPGAKKYEVAGFFFWQGEKDCGSAAHAETYEKNLVAFIKQLRKDFDAPNAKFVLATLGEAKKGEGGNKGKVTDAQLAVDGKDGKHKEFKGNVATVYANPYCHGGSGNSHYGGNCETYMDTGEAMGRAMVELLGK